MLVELLATLSVIFAESNVSSDIQLSFYIMILCPAISEYGSGGSTSVFNNTPSILTTCRPVTDTGEWVTPEGLTSFHLSHCFRAPCCLCSHMSRISRYMQCDIHIAEDGPYLGEYVATCATRSCDYAGSFLYQNCCLRCFNRRLFLYSMSGSFICPSGFNGL